MITKRIEFRYAPKPVKLKKEQKPAKFHKPVPPFTVFCVESSEAVSKTFEKAMDEARKASKKTKENIYVKDADGVVVFSITTTNPQEQEEPSEPKSGRADRPDVSDRSSNRPD